jgi:hypothetical protein
MDTDQMKTQTIKVTIRAEFSEPKSVTTYTARIEVSYDENRNMWRHEYRHNGVSTWGETAQDLAVRVAAEYMRAEAGE